MSRWWRRRDSRGLKKFPDPKPKGEADRKFTRLRQLVELADVYDSQVTERADNFAKYVSTQKIEDPTSTNVRVMTIHQSKGLQFDTVVLPELDVRLSGQTPTVVVGRDSPTKPVHTVCRYIRKELLPLLPERCKAMIEGHTHQVVSESLCVLYVAVTRAIHALHLIIGPPADNEQTIPKTFAGLLRCALADDTKAVDGELLYENGRAGWSDGRPDEQPAPHEADRMESAVEFASAIPEVRLAEGHKDRTKGLDRVSPSGLVGGRKIRLDNWLRLDSPLATTRGLLFHAWFEQIEWLDDGEPGDAELRQAAKRFSDAHLDIEVEMAQFRRMLSQPTIRSVLSHVGYQDLSQLGFKGEWCVELFSQPFELEVLREWPFAVRDQAAVVQGKIDRLVLFRQDERVVAADIIDFKTDALSRTDQAGINDAVENYRAQVVIYRNAAAQLFRLEPFRISARLSFVEPGVVCVVQ